MSITDIFTRKLKGDSRFVTDIMPDNAIRGLTVRSTIARGEILSIQIPDLPEGYLVAGFGDIPGKKTLSVFGKEMPVLAEKRICYFGEPILLLGGTDMEQLAEIAENIKIEYKEEIPALTSDSVKLNRLSDHIKFTEGDIDYAFVTADKIIEGVYKTGLHIPYNIEPESAIAIFNKEQTIIYVSSHYPFNIRDNIAGILGLARKNVRVIIPDTCAPSGGKLVIPVLISAHAALLAHLSGRAVKIEYSQSEDINFGVKKYPLQIKCRSALNNQGILTGNIFEIQVDNGCYDIFSEQISRKMITMARNYYVCRNTMVDITFNSTDKAPQGGFNGMGESEFCFAAELHTNRIAGYYKSDPMLWKKKNLGQAVKKGQLPAAVAVMEKVISVSDFRRKHGAYAALVQKQDHIHGNVVPVRGIGLALCPHHHIAGYEKELASYSVTAVFGKDRKLRIRSSAVDMGESKSALFAIRASKIMDIHVSEVFIEQVDTFHVPDSGATAGSKAVIILSRLIDQCCQSLKRRLKKESPPVTVTKRFSIRPENSYLGNTWESTVVEIEIDPISFEIECRGIWIVIDAGQIVNPEIARAHVEAAALLNFEFAHMEIKDFEHLMNYTVPGSKDIPPIAVYFLDHDNTSSGPGSLGDQPVCGVAPAFVNAVSQACSIDINMIPVTPELIQSFQVKNDS